MGGVVFWAVRGRAWQVFLAAAFACLVAACALPDAAGAHADHGSEGTMVVEDEAVAPAGDEGALATAGTWRSLKPSGAARQEVSYVQAGGKFYLAGGSKTGLHQRYDPETGSWTNVKPLPLPDDYKLDHIQGVELGGKIYYIGGLSQWPDGHVDTVYVYDPAEDSFEVSKMPAERARGAGGIAVYGGKIYYAGGLHDGVVVPWFDVYDPATKSWTKLPDMPRARDHFHAAVVDGRLYAIGGRAKDINAVTKANDAYDFARSSWQSGLAPLPTARGGFAAAVLGKEVLIVGGEGNGKAYDTVEAYDTSKNTWRTLEPMPTARHGIQAAVCNGGVYIAAGGKIQGGSGPTDAHEVFFLGSPTECDFSPPQTAITSGPSGTVGSASASFAFSSSEAGSTFQCKLDGGAWSGCSSPKSYSGLADGGHAFSVRATDAAGNADPTPATRSWTVKTAVRDTTPPETWISSGPTGPTRATTAAFAFSSSEPGSTFLCSLDGAPFASCASPTAYSGLDDGRHSFAVKATDGAGNTDATPAARAWTVDTVRPSVRRPTPRPGSRTRDRTPVISATVRDAGSELVKANVRLSVDGRKILRFSYDAGRDRLQYVPPRALRVGRHTVRVVAGDAAGNRTVRTWRFGVAR